MADNLTLTITKLTPLAGEPTISACACCGSPGALFEFITGGNVTKAVNCDSDEFESLTNGFGMLGASCPLYTPSGMAFNFATRQAAIEYWNAFQAVLREKQGAPA